MSAPVIQDPWPNGNYTPDISKSIDGLISILAIRYLEPSYKETIKCIEDTKLKVVYVDRDRPGYGSLAEAINRGMQQMTSKYVFIVTNVTFDPHLPLTLASHIGDADIIHPSFNSDHKHLQVQQRFLDGCLGGIGFVPFVEFTAPLVNREKWLPVDESMPYWGFDLDHGWRVWDSGGKVLCDYSCTIGHTYIRNIKKGNSRTVHPSEDYTRRRLQRRRRFDIQTKNILKHKYGTRWAGVLFHKSESDIGRFIRDVVEKKFPGVMKKQAIVGDSEEPEIVRVIKDIRITHGSLNADGSCTLGGFINESDVITAEAYNRLSDSVRANVSSDGIGYLVRVRPSDLVDRPALGIHDESINDKP